MDNAQAIRIISQCAKTYQDELNNKNVLFLYRLEGQLHALEACFLPRHFHHLTGVQFSGSSSNFLRLCLEHKLSPQQISLATNGTTEMKLQVLPELVNIHKTARMIGSYDHSKMMLYTEKLVGSVRGCMGFVLDGNYFCPNTVLREDIRKITCGCNAMIAVLVKDLREITYSQVSYNSIDTKLYEILRSDDFKHFFRSVE